MKNRLGEAIYDAIPWVALALVAVVFTALEVYAASQHDYVKFVEIFVTFIVLIVCLYPAYVQYKHIVDIAYARERKLNMNIVSLAVLVEDGMKMPPRSLITHNYGPESIIDGNSLVDGTSVHLRGSVTEIQDWIRQVGGTVWTSSNPMLGVWMKNHFEAKKTAR